MEFYKEKEKELKEMFERLSELNGTIQAHRIYTENNFALEKHDETEFIYLNVVAQKAIEFLEAYKKVRGVEE